MKKICLLILFSLSMAVTFGQVTQNPASPLLSRDLPVVSASHSPDAGESSEAIQITGNDSVCGGIHRYGVSLENPAGTYTYNWEATGGSLFSTASGATCDIYWNSTSSVTTGTAKVTVTDNSSNVSVATLAVTIFPQVIPALTGDTNPCPGVMRNYATDPGQSHYQWISSAGIIQSGQGTPNAAMVWVGSGNQLLSVSYQSAAGCVATKEFLIPVKKQTVAKVYGPAEAAIDSKLVYSTQGGMSNYSWGVSGGEILSGLMTSAVMVQWKERVSTIVSVDFTDMNGCPSTSTNKAVKIWGVGVGEESRSGMLKIYPNPVHERLTVDFDALPAEENLLMLTDLAGRVLLNQSVAGFPCTFDMTNLARGLYILKLRSGNTIHSAKIIRN